MSSRARGIGGAGVRGGLRL